MNKRLVLSSCAAVTLSLTIASAQIANQTPTQSPVQGSTQGTTGQTRVGTNTETETQMTVSGCIARESEHTNARGGVLGTGVGAANEFVLANATTARSGATANAQIAGGVSGSTSTGTTASATGTSGTTATAGAGSSNTTMARTATGGTAYNLTGNRESELALYVGKRVEIVGTLDANTRGAGASANAGVNAGGASTQAGAGVSAGTQGTPMQQLTIVSFRPIEGDCK
jgi:hypothetical protein